MSKRIQEIVFQLRNMNPKHLSVSSTSTIEDEAADLLESLQRERQERENPEPLTFNQLSERVGKPVYVGVLERWEIIDFIEPELFHIHSRSGNVFRFGATRLYATEPKGDATT